MGLSPHPNEENPPFSKLDSINQVELDLYSDRSAVLRGITTMAQNNSNNNQGIANSYSLISFARSHGKMQVGQFVNSDTGETFSSCIFTDSRGNRSFVAFSSKLGELSPREIAAQKDELQVVELTSGSHILCRQGQNTWQDVDLGL